MQASLPSEPSRERTSSTSGFIDAFLPAGMDLRQSLSASVRSRGTSTESETASKLESLRDNLIGNTSQYAKAELGWRPKYPSWRDGLEALIRKGS